MRFSIPDIVSEEDLDFLDKTRLNHSMNDWSNPIIKRVLAEIQKVTSVELCPESYWRVESRSQGHKWHVDTGDTNHMPWCRIGCSVLISSPSDFQGGVLKYRDEDVKQEIYTLYGHTSDVEHMVTEHTPSGARRVLLLFI